jgi:hypothetical protein
MHTDSATMVDSGCGSIKAQEERFQSGMRKLLGKMHVFIIFIVLVFIQVYKYVEFFKYSLFNVQFIYLNFASVELSKIIVKDFY